MDFLAALLLSITQGLTQFLPISSTGHIVLVREVIDITEVNGLALVGVLYLAGTLAVLTYFWGDVWILLQAFVRKLSRLPTNDKDITLLYALTLGTLPAVVLGLIFEETLTRYLYNPETVATMLFLGAVFFMYVEWRYYLNPPRGFLTPKNGFLIGLFQVLALIPGLSRTGFTLTGGMLLGLTRLESARFSFLLAIPVTFGLGVKKLLTLMLTQGSVNWLLIAFAAVVSYVVSLIAIHLFLIFIRKYTLWPFIWYSIVLSCLVGYVALFV